MYQRIITLLCAAGLAISAPAFASGLKVRPDAPARYEVKPGDTLWSISGRYLYSPWQWNRLWGANRSEIRNPHLIYPGQVLVLSYVDGQPRLGFEGGTGGIQRIKLSPKVRVLGAGYGIQTLNVDFFGLFMQNPQAIPVSQTQNAPKLIAGPENRLLITKGDRVYTYGITEPGRYLVYRVRNDVTDPETKKFLGQEVVFSGIVSTLPYGNSALAGRSAEDAQALPEGEYYTRPHPLIKVPTQTAQPLMVEEAVSEIRVGDFLLKMTDEEDRFNMMPHAPGKPVRARVVSVFDGVSEAGQFQTVTLDQGSLAGLSKGTVLSVYKQARQVKVDMEETGSNGRRGVVKYVSIPADETALVMVYRVSDNLASAIVLDSKTNVSVGDSVAEPGHDLDNMSADGRHAPNAPQESHSDELGRGNAHNDLVNP